MPRNDSYPYQKPYNQDKSYEQENTYDYNNYNNYQDYDTYKMPYDVYEKNKCKPHHCCPWPYHQWPEPKPCHCHCHHWSKPDCKPEPEHDCKPDHKPDWKPEHKPEHKKLITAQLSYNDPQQVLQGDPLRFNSFDGISNTNANAPLYTDGTTITFNITGRFIVDFGSDVHFDEAQPNNNNDVILTLKLNGTLLANSRAHGRNTDTNDDGRQTLNKSVLINVYPGATLQLVAEQNDDFDNEFLWTNLVIDQKFDKDKY